MSPQTEIWEIGKEKLAHIKTFLDKLEAKLALGKSEVKEMLENERENVAHFINERKVQWKHKLETSEAHKLRLFEKLEQVENKLARRKVADKKRFEEQKNDALHAIHELEFAIQQAWDDVGFRYRLNLHELKDKLDSYRLELALAEFGHTDELDTKKRALQVAITGSLARINKEAQTDNKLDQFAEEIGASFEHMKKEFSELLS